MSRWYVETTPDFDRAIGKLDRVIQRRVISYLEQLATLDDPRARVRGLTGPLVGYWRYRIGDYRLIADIQSSRLVIVAISVAHRSRAHE